MSSPSKTGAHPKGMPYAGDCSVIVLTVDGQPEVKFARSSFGIPRAEFVDQVIQRLYGVQESGIRHEWETLEKPKPIVEVPQTENPGVHDWLTEKVNG